MPGPCRLPGRAAPGGVQGSGRAGRWAVRSTWSAGRAALPRFAPSQLLSAAAPRVPRTGGGEDATLE